LSFYQSDLKCKKGLQEILTEKEGLNFKRNQQKVHEILRNIDTFQK